MTTREIQLLPRCDDCGVEYVEDYEGPCQEPRGTYNEHTGWSRVCPGRVSWHATAEALYERAPECDRTTVCVLDRGHRGSCQRPGGVKVVTTADA